MAESSASLMQRVEALEQISHARVAERVGEIEQRVSRIESAREAEEPHVAAKSDVARLETRIAETQSTLQADIADAKVTLEKQLRQFLMWMIGTAIALTAVVIAAPAFIVAQLP